MKMFSWLKLNSKVDKGKGIIELYAEGAEYFKEKFNSLTLEKQVAALAVIIEMEPNQKGLNKWLIDNYSPLITSVWREKVTEGYSLDKAVETLKEKKQGIEARIIPPLEKTFQIEDFRIECYDMGFTEAYGGPFVSGYFKVTVKTSSGWKEIEKGKYTWFTQNQIFWDDLCEAFNNSGFVLKIEDKEVISQMISSFYKEVLAHKELAETKSVWTIKDYYKIKGKF